MIAGLDWCTEPKGVGVGALVANHLCRKHNNALSVTDETALQLFTTLRDQFDDAAPPLKAPVTIDGPALERWFLKTAINLLLARRTKMQWLHATAANTIPDMLVNIALGHQRFVYPTGLYFYGGLGHRTDSADAVVMTVRQQDDELIRGLDWYFRGFRFLLWLDPAQELAAGTSTHIWKAGDEESPLHYHLPQLTLTRRGAPFAEVHFAWSRPENEVIRRRSKPVSHLRPAVTMRRTHSAL
jgi:hypothetical protein